jgi:hypothetical protein
MHRTAARVVVFALACLSVATAVGAARQADQPVPRLVKFTGVVAGVQGTVGVTFAFYAEQASETPLWTETQRVIVDETGRYAVHLGATRQEGLPLDLFAMGEARWLGVRVEGQAEHPRVLLVSVPYALKAADADTVGGKPLSAFLLAGERTGVGADGLNYVNTRVSSSGLASGGTGAPSGGAGSANFIGMFTDTTTLGNSVIYQTPVGNVGLNTLAPAAAFHVLAPAAPAAYFDVYSNALGALPVVYRAARGTPFAPSAVQANDILGGLAVRGYGTSTFSAGRGQVMFKAAENWTDAANGTYLQFTTTPLGSGTWLERMRIDPAGRVGIGTPTPGQLLSVAGVVESTSGGFRFPDGTTQATAATSGATNNAFGTSSLRSNTTGQWNAAFGESTLSANTEGSCNSAFGNASLQLNTTGVYNTGFGYQSLRLNATGNTNAAFGADSLYNNTTGSRNAAFGASSLAANTTGMYNTAFGSTSLYANTTGGYNAAFGDSSLVANTTGVDNGAFGTSALSDNSTGGYNAALGAWAGHLNTTGTGNTYVGYNAGPDAGHTGLWYSGAIGASAVVTQSNSLVLGGPYGSGSAVRVGIGTSAPDTTLQVVGDIKVGTADENGCLKNFAGAGIAGTCSSDRRLKTDIQPFGRVLDRLVRLQPVRFVWRVDQFPEYHFGAGLNSGLVAQDVEQVFPEMVSSDERGYKMVNYAELPYLTLQAVKELNAKVNALEAQNTTKDEQVRKLTEQVEALTRAVAALSGRKQ